MKIAYIVEPRNVIGGGVRAAINLVKAMQNYYQEEAVIFGTYKGSVEDNEVGFVEVNTVNPISVAYWNDLRRFIRNFHPDVVHCLGLYTALLLIILKRLFRLDYKIVCTVHRVTMNMRFRLFNKIVLPYIAKGIDYATFLTRYQKRHYFDIVGFSPSKNIVVPNVIYVERYTPEEIAAKRKDLENKVGTDLTTCYVGRIIPSKNIEDTIRLVSILNKRGFNLGCIFVGGYETSYFEKLTALIRSENVGARVHFVGYVNNPTLYNAATTTTTTTTHGEALPNLMVESFALGKVFFSSDIPQMTDLIENGRDGITSSLTDLESFADSIEEIYKNSVVRNSIEKQALNTYEKKYNPRLVAAKYHTVYEECKNS